MVGKHLRIRKTITPLITVFLYEHGENFGVKPVYYAVALIPASSSAFCAQRHMLTFLATHLLFYIVKIVVHGIPASKIYILIFPK
jgi:hypothetical protein